MTQRCYVCKNEKSLEDFYRNRKAKNGRDSRCIPCAKARNLSYNARESKKIYNRARSRKRNSGFTPEEFAQKLEEQDNRCAICGTGKPTSVNWHADHCHKTKQKRGILCQKCNMGLGLLNDDTEIMEKAITYLNKYKISEVI